MSWVAGERDCVADVFHAGCVADQPFKPAAKATVRNRAELAQLEIPICQVSGILVEGVKERQRKENQSRAKQSR